MAKKKTKEIKPINLKWWIFPLLTALVIAIPPVYMSIDLTWLVPATFKPVEYEPAAIPIMKPDFTKPPINLSHIFVMDRASKTVLLEVGGRNQVFPASTTKMMTALISMDAFDLDKTITVTKSYSEDRKSVV